MNIEIRGLDELRSKLGNLQNGMREITSDALVAGANQLEGYVKANIRDRGLVDTGNLLNNWNVEGGDMEAVLGTDTPYAAIHEFGGITGRGYTTVIPARPYLRPAVDEHKDEIVQAVKVNLERLIAERMR